MRPRTNPTVLAILLLACGCDGGTQYQTKVFVEHSVFLQRDTESLPVDTSALTYQVRRDETNVRRRGTSNYVDRTIEVRGPVKVILVPADDWEPPLERQSRSSAKPADVGGQDEGNKQQ